MSCTEEPFDIRAAIGMSEAAKLLRGRGGKAAHVESVRRWAMRGCNVPGGGKVYLRSVLINAERLTLPIWVEQFNEERIKAGLSHARRQQERVDEARGGRTERSRKAAQRRAAAYLDRVGVK